MMPNLNHAHQVQPIQSRSFDIKSTETGERVRVIIEQLDEGTHVQWPSRVTLFDLVVDDLFDREVGQFADSGVDVLSVNHPYQ